MRDRGLRLQVDTKELTADQYAEIMKLFMTSGYFVYSENSEDLNVNLDDLPPVALEENEKSPSQRQRAVLFLLWKQSGSKGLFDSFYRQEMEKIIEHYKDKLI